MSKCLQCLTRSFSETLLMRQTSFFIVSLETLLNSGIRWRTFDARSWLRSCVQSTFILMLKNLFYQNITIFVSFEKSTYNVQGISSKLSSIFKWYNFTTGWSNEWSSQKTLERADWGIILCLQIYMSLRWK